MSIVSNGMISRIARYFISLAAIVVFKIYKTQMRPRVEYYFLVWAPLSRQKNRSAILILEGIQKNGKKD